MGQLSVSFVKLQSNLSKKDKVLTLSPRIKCTTGLELGTWPYRFKEKEHKMRITSKYMRTSKISMMISTI